VAGTQSTPSEGLSKVIQARTEERTFSPDRNLPLTPGSTLSCEAWESLIGKMAVIILSQSIFVRTQCTHSRCGILG
jgi:hypothetical protein